MNMTIFDYNLIPNGKKLYILGVDKCARQFAIRLINNNIYFYGFVSLEDTLKQKSTLYNKPVINASACVEDDDIVISVSYCELEKAEKVLLKFFLEKKIIEVEVLKPKIKKLSSAVIYGTGSRAESVFEECKNFLNITFFVDSSEKKWGKKYCGREIISPQNLSELPEDTLILIGSTFYEGIYNNIKKYIMDDYRIYYIEYRLQISGSPINRFNDFVHVISVLNQRKCKITFYGEKKIVTDVIKKIKLLDIHNTEAVTRNNEEEDGTIFQLLYYDWDNRACVITDDVNEKSINLLEETGIPDRCFYWLKDFRPAFCYNSSKKYKFILDPTFGYSSVSLERKLDEWDYPGFVKYEYNDYRCENECVILIIGGSTSEIYFARESSWGEYLSKILTGKQISHTIYVGAVGGYSNIQEFLKLTRDGIFLNPDIVLSYSGANNINGCMCYGHPFIHSYQKELFEWMQEQNRKNSKSFFTAGDFLNGYVNYGMKVLNYDVFEYWLLYEKIMQSICNGLSIKFKAFLQPVLFSKLKFGEFDRQLLLNLYEVIAGSMEDMYKYSEKEGDKENLSTFDVIRRSIIFRKGVEKYKEKYSNWLVDFSDIFDTEDDIYIDYCHVHEKGNKIIAKHIYETIKDDITEVLKCKNKHNK